MYRSEPVPSIRGLSRIEIVLPDELVGRVERAAAVEHTTFIEIIRRLIDRGLPPDFPAQTSTTQHIRHGGESMTSQPGIADLNTGAPVYSRDGKKIGTIKDVSGMSFKVGALLRNFWLSTDAVDYVDAEGVHLFIAHEDVSAYKLPRPAAMEATTDPSEDRLISDEEKQEQRERMEREIMDARRYHLN